MEAVREIRLHGVLGRRFGAVHRLAVDSVAEAIQALSVVLPGFEAHLRRHSEPGYRVWVGRHNIGRDELKLPVGDREAIRISPVVRGAKKAGVFQTIAGVVLIVAGMVASAYGYPVAGKMMIQAGIAMVIGGVIQILSPQRKTEDSTTDNQPSYNFGGPVNVANEGGPVPLCYGRMVIGSVVVSGGISTTDISPAAPVTLPAQTLPADQPLDPSDTSQGTGDGNGAGDGGDSGDGGGGASGGDAAGDGSASA